MIWNFCVRRPVLTGVVWVVVAIFGVWGYTQLPIREHPDVDFPLVSVNVVLPGAEPEVIETEIIEPLEEQINTIEGLKDLVSTARAEVAGIGAEFELWRDIDLAAQDIRDRVERARRELPDDVLEPVVRKMDPDADAIMWIALAGDERWDELRMTRYADDVIKPRLETLRGVGQIQIGGERQLAVRLRLDPARLAAHHLTVQDVVDAVRRNNVDIPTGRVRSLQREFMVKTDGQFSSAEPFNALIVARRNGSVVRIGEIGEAVAGIENDRQVASFTGERTVGLGVVKQSDANTVALARALRSRMAEIAERFPPGLRYEIASDQSVFVEESVRDLLRTIFLATGLVVIVVLFFLRNPRGTLITSLAIPTSLLAALALIHAFGFSLNTLTMLALILAIGIVVDDAIVVLESSYRHMEDGAEPRPATRTGTTEVAFPAIANTLSLAAVFIPVAFTAGMVGRFFFEFGITVTVTVLASTATALTLTPMLCSRLLRVPESHGRLFRATERALAGLERIYTRLLAAAFSRRLVTVAVGGGAFLLGMAALTQIPREFSPSVDRSDFMISFETPEGSTLDATEAYARRLEATLREIPEVEHWFLAVGLSRGAGRGQVNRGISFVHLAPRSERERHQSEIMQDARGRFAQIPGGRAYVLQGSGPGPPGSPIEFVLQHSDLDTLALWQERVVQWMRDEPEYVGVNSDLKMNSPQLRITIHRDKAAEMAISVADISNTLRYLLGEPDISKIEQGSQRFDVITEVVGKGRMVPAALGDVYTRGRDGQLVSLANLVEFEETVGPSAINHFNRLRSVTISASTPPGVALGDALAKLRRHVEQSLPPEFDHTLSGRAQAFQESFLNLTIAIAFSLLFVYLVLAAEFESLIYPFVILVALPLATIGAFGGLWLLGFPLSVYAFIGLIMLMGLVTKNGILLIDYTNVLIARGVPRIEAAQRAARVRFRPVLMTATSTMLGMLPIAIGMGAGGEARSPLGICVVAGLFSSTLLTLVVIPVVYTLTEEGRARARAWLGREGPPRPLAT